MIPKVNNRGHSFKGVMAYLMHDKDKAKTSERVAWFETGNMYTNDPLKAAKVMAWTDKNADYLKSRNGTSLAGKKREAGAVYHYSLAWAKTETPDKDHQQEQVLETLKRLGLEKHEYVLVAHNDTTHAHIHVVANLTHPETGKRNSLTQDMRVLQKWALEYEREHGMHCHVREENAKTYETTGSPTKHRDKKQDYSRRVTRAFTLSDDGKSFVQALKTEGLQLAPARRKSEFLIVDEKGDIQKLTRQLDPTDKYEKLITHGAKGKLIRERLKDIDRASLPDADVLSAQIKTALEKEEQVKPSKLKDDFELSAKEQKPEIAEPQQDLQEQFKASAEGETKNIEMEDISYNYDRDAEETARQIALEEAAYRAGQEETETEKQLATQQEINREQNAQYPDIKDGFGKAAQEENISYEYDRDAEETARQIALEEAAHKAAQEKVKAEKEQHIKSKNPLETQVVSGKEIGSFAETLKENDPEVFKEVLLKERIEERRNYWQLPKLEKKKQEAEQQLRACSGWFDRHVRQSKYGQAKQAVWAAGKTLEHARQRWQGDIEAIYADRDPAFINQELEKRGFAPKYPEHTKRLERLNDKDQTKELTELQEEENQNTLENPGIKDAFEDVRQEQENSAVNDNKQLEEELSEAVNDNDLDVSDAVKEQRIWDKYKEMDRAQGREKDDLEL